MVLCLLWWSVLQYWGLVLGWHQETTRNNSLWMIKYIGLLNKLFYTTIAIILHKKCSGSAQNKLTTVLKYLYNIRIFLKVLFLSNLAIRYVSVTFCRYIWFVTSSLVFSSHFSIVTRHMILETETPETEHTSHNIRSLQPPHHRS